MHTPWPEWASGLPTPAAITAGPYFLGCPVLKPISWRQAFLESKFGEAGWTAIQIPLSRIFKHFFKIIPKSSSGGGFGFLRSVLGGLGESFQKGGVHIGILGRFGGCLGALEMLQTLRLPMFRKN